MAGDATMAQIDRWLAGYMKAWRDDSSENISAIFEPDAQYMTEPFRDPIVGLDGIVEWWQRQGEASVPWEFEGGVIASNGPLHVVQGVTTYPARQDPPREAVVYHNVWLVQLAESGRAARFVEYWMKAE